MASPWVPWLELLPSGDLLLFLVFVLLVVILLLLVFVLLLFFLLLFLPRRDGDVAVTDEESHKTVTSRFTVGPLQLEVSRTVSSRYGHINGSRRT